MQTELKLSEKFLSRYKNKHPDWGFDGLGYIVYLRTYSRVKENGEQEQWWETVKRITEGNFKIEEQRLKQLKRWNKKAKVRLEGEMCYFYFMVFNLLITPPGRGLWMSGTAYSEKCGDAENNCWGVSMKPQQYHPDSPNMVSFASCFTFDQAMKGGGVGVNVQHKYTNQMPKVRNHVNCYFICDVDHQDFDELEKVVHEINVAGGVIHTIEDSRQGWVTALGFLIDSHFTGVDYITFDVSKVRPKGSPIKGFGGIASGPAPLVEMLKEVNEILNSNQGAKVSPTNWGDIIQLIGNCVVAGNVRRTALILIGDVEDNTFMTSKDYSRPANIKASKWRWASNNSVDIGIKTTRDVLRKVACGLYYNGEPGYVNIELAKNFGRIIDGYVEDIDGEVEVFNPCGEIPLPDASPCNLFEINLPALHKHSKQNLNIYRDACYMAARYAYRITFRQYDWAATQRIVEKHRRIGVGVTGVTDWLLLTGFTLEEAGQHLDKMYKCVDDANQDQAEELKANCSIKLTTVKPSGTVSILMGVSPGQHFHWAPFMIRRIRLAGNSSLVGALRQCGYNIEPAINGKDTLVVEFPVKAPTAHIKGFKSAKQVSLAEQAELQAMLCTYWSDNAVSATLSFHKAKRQPVFFDNGVQLLDKFGHPQLEINPEEENIIIEEITDILDKYKGIIKSTTLLPYASDTYEQMPYEEITEKKYEEMAANIKHKPWEVISRSIVLPNEEPDDTMECHAGACPLK